MRETTLCYIESDGKYLMLHRVKKRNDPNHDKWIGVGGGIEPGETPEECLLREVREETGLQLTAYCARGIIDFINDVCESERMYLYTADGFTGALLPCDEGELAWVEIERVCALPLWEGDKIFLRLLHEGTPFFRLRLEYHGETLLRAALNGRELAL